MFTPEDWDRINTDAEKFFKREDRGVFDSVSNAATSAYNGVSNAASSAYNGVSNAANSAYDSVSNVYNSAGETINQGVNKVNDTWTEIKGQYVEIKEKMDTILKIIKLLPWILGGLFLFIIFSTLAICIYFAKHHKTNKRRKVQRMENLTAAVNNLTRVYCKQNNIEYSEDEVVHLKVDDESYEKEE